MGNSQERKSTERAWTELGLFLVCLGLALAWAGVRKWRAAREAWAERQARNSKRLFE